MCPNEFETRKNGSRSKYTLVIIVAYEKEREVEHLAHTRADCDPANVHRDARCVLIVDLYPREQ